MERSWFGLSEKVVPNYVYYMKQITPPDLLGAEYNTDGVYVL